ncbi:MAG: substrate-binding domain-containing protein [Clostridia bacterium]|nr:substrate-binding domain-containing protein [Clostridia bacterium]
MQIKIYVLPEYKKSFWSTQSLKAVAAEILRKRYSADYIEASSVTEIDFDKEFADGEKRVLLYIGYSLWQTPTDLSYLAEHGIHTLLLNYESNNFTGSCSRVLLNYRDAIEKCVGYLTANGHDRIALIGVNPHSTVDMLKKDRFSEYLRMKGEDPARSVYYNNGSVEGCLESFLHSRADYNAVICVNDVSALALLRRLKETDLRVPEDLYVISCGFSTMLAEHAAPTLTTVSADQNEIGAQAVQAYASLIKNPGDITLTVRVAPKLVVRGSTNFDPDPGTVVAPSLPSPAPLFDFYADPDAKSFFNAESLLLGSDELDRGILAGILSGETYASIAERLYTSENVISYRLKRMFKITGCEKKSELLALLTPYFN